MNNKLNIQHLNFTDVRRAPYNPRKMSAKERESLKKSIERFGLVEPLVFNQRTGNLVGGHQRLTELEQLGWTSADFTVIDISEEDEKALNIALNKISGTWDENKLRELMTGLHEASYDLSYTGFSLDDLENTLGDEFLQTTGLRSVPEEDFEVPVEAHVRKIQTGIKIGDVFQLGEHRLMCGDSTNPEHVDALLGGSEISVRRAIPVIMVTDPPYGVEYNPSWRNETNLKNGIRRPTRAEGKVENDDIVDWSKAYELFPGRVAYVWHAGKYASAVQESIEKVGFSIINQIIWVKPHFVLSRGDYHWKHEPCWYAVRNGENHNWTGDRSQTTVWEIAGMNAFGGTRDTADETTGHGTQKPLECMKRPILNNSREGDGVYDPFTGSGTTLIACEQTKRKAYCMEISPQYCQVVIDRWEKFTGQKAEKM